MGYQNAQGVAWISTEGGANNVQAYYLKCHLCNRTGHFVRVCRSGKLHTKDPSTNAVRMIKAAQGGIQPAPTIEATPNGLERMQILPDSGADISVDGPSIIRDLRDHPGNLVPYQITPCAANGQKMTPIGKLTVQIRIGTRPHKEELRIYQKVQGLIVSWKACMVLGILPLSYPEPIKVHKVASEEVTSEDLIKEFPSVLDNTVKLMEGEQFHIALVDEAKPFCVHTPRAIPYAYREKLRGELQTAGDNHSCSTPHGMVCPHHGSAEEGYRRNPNVC